MPEWMTPLLCPVWWAATRGSLSSTTSRARGCRSVRATAVASPTMPAPTMAMSADRDTPRSIARGPSLEGERDRAVVRAQHVWEDGRRAHAVAQLLGDEEVVDAPAHVARPRAALQIPPGVVPGLAREEPEGVQVAVGEQAAHPLALHGQETRSLRVVLRAGQIDLLVRRVDVAAQHDPLPAPPQRLGEPQELVVEHQLVTKPLGPHGAVGEVDVEQVEVRVLRVDDAPLCVQHRGAELGGDALGLLTREGRGAAVPLLLRRAPVGAVAGWAPELFRELVVLDLGLLHAEGVRLLRGEERSEEHTS